MWFQLLGLKLLVLWQLVQLLEPVGMWLADLPLAVEPLWQLAQLVAEVKPAWSMPLAGEKALVEWQLSQARVVLTCVADLPGAVEPLWQTWQLPACTWLWLNLMPPKALVVWQLSQAWDVGTCWLDITTLPLAKRAPLMWQLLQSRGVPLKTPFWWHDSQRVVMCAPVSE